MCLLCSKASSATSDALFVFLTFCAPEHPCLKSCVLGADPLRAADPMERGLEHDRCAAAQVARPVRSAFAAFQEEEDEEEPEEDEPVRPRAPTGVLDLLGQLSKRRFWRWNGDVAIASLSNCRAALNSRVVSSTFLSLR